jgi:hypothetical protein
LKPVLLILFNGILACCTSRQVKVGSSSKTISLSFRWQFFSDDQRMVNIEDSLQITYVGDLVIYRINHPGEVRQVLTDTSGIITRDSITSERTKYSYFIYKEKDPYGVEYAPANPGYRQKFLVDSFLQSKLSITEAMFDNSNDSLVEVGRVDNNTTLFEKYIPKLKTDDSYPDSSYYYFSNELNEYEYSFSKRLDQLKGKKLYKILFIYNPVPKSHLPFDVPRRVFRFALRKTTVENPEEMTNIIERFKDK